MDVASEQPATAGAKGSSFDSKLNEIGEAMARMRDGQPASSDQTVMTPPGPGFEQDLTGTRPVTRRTDASLNSGAGVVSIEDEDVDPIVPRTGSRDTGWQPTASDEQSRLVNETAAMLRQRIASAEEPPFELLLQLAALDALEPGIFNTYFLGRNGRSPSHLLTEDEMAMLMQWRDMIESVRTGAADPDSMGVRDLIDRIEAGAAAMTSLSDIRIREAKLCRRVETIGRYDEMERYDDTYRMLADVTKRHRAIVYVEPIHFGHRHEVRNGVEGYSVELEQDLLLYRLDEQDDMLAWQLLGQEISEFSRVQRRDFFLTYVVSLPPTLSVGKYRLKVVLRDRVSGATAESSINLEMVGNTQALGAAN